VKLTLALAVAVGLIWSSATGAADRKTLRLGHLELSYDAERWRAEPVGDTLATMLPTGTVARKLDAITISRAPADGIEGCRALGTHQFQGSLYEEPTAGPIEVAGVAGIRLNAHTRCRNATPTGVVVCVPYRGMGYLLKATQFGCRSPGYNLFSGVDPLRELLDGIRFVP
jgi:hypothetical protein